MFEFLNGNLHIDPVDVDLEEIFKTEMNYPVDFNDVKGQEHVKRCLEVAAAGGHNIDHDRSPGLRKNDAGQTSSHDPSGYEF